MTTPAENGGVHAFQSASSVNLAGSSVNVVGRDSYSFTTYQVLGSPLAEGFSDVHKVKIWLTDINFNVIQMDNLSQRAPNTGIWVIKNRKFQAWLKEGGILWGTGMPGAGKTILSSIVIDHLRELAKTQGNICVAFAFCRYTDRISVKDILAALLKQLLECYPDLVWPFVEPLVRAHYNKGTHPSQIELFEVLRRIATSGLFATGYCVLDGLDEAKNDVQIDLLSVFSSLPINFFITSRPLTSLRDLAPNAVFMDIVVHDSDIALLVEQRISRMHGRLIFKHNDDLKREVISKIQSKASGMFLLASLHLDMLEECLSVKDFRDSLDHLPDGVNAMYAATMGRIEKQRILPVVQRLLAWVIYSRRPLRTEDLERALAVCPTTYQFDPQRRVETESIVSLCCGLLTIDPKSRLVRLIHYTAREYLKVYLKVNLPENPHTLIASTCAMLLLQYGFANFDVENEGRQMAADFRSKPLLEYAYSSWFAHAQQSSSKATILVDFVRRCRRYPLQQAFWPRKWDKLKSIHIPAAFKLVDILRQIVERNPSGETPGISSARLCDVNATTALGATALTLAASLGHLEIVNVLLGVEGVDVNVAAFHDMTAIAEASSNGDISIVERLLQVDGIDFNARDQNGRTPLLIASSKGHDDVVKALVNTDGIAVNLPDSDGNTALIEASRNGHVEVVRTLLGVEGIDVNAVDEDGWTALISAVWVGNNVDEVVEALLGHGGVDTSIPDYDGHTALMVALLKGRHGAVRVLMNLRDVDIKPVFRKDDFALIYASSNGLDEVVDALLKNRRPLINDADAKGMTILMREAQDGHTNLVKALLAVEGIHFNARDNLGETALMKASARGHIEAVQALLKMKALAINATDARGSTALVHAASNGHFDVVMALWDALNVVVTRIPSLDGSQHGWAVVAATKDKPHDISIRKKLGAKTLINAASSGHLELVRALVEDDTIDVNAIDSLGATALMHASRNGHFDIVRTLLKKKSINVSIKDADGTTTLLHAISSTQSVSIAYSLLAVDPATQLEAADSHGCTPLMHASWNGCIDIVELLLEQTCSTEAIDSQDIFGVTALMRASFQGHANVVDALLRVIPSINPNIRDQNGSTSLIHASANGHFTVVKSLLKNRSVDVDIRDSTGNTALDIATSKGYVKIINALQQASFKTLRKFYVGGPTPMASNLSSPRPESISSSTFSGGSRLTLYAPD